MNDFGVAEHLHSFQAASDNGTFLYESIIKHNYCKTIVEIGVAFGTTTAYLCKGAEDVGGHVFGFDLWEQHGLKSQYKQLGSKETVEAYLKGKGHNNFTLTKIDSKQSDFPKILKKMCPVIDFAFIDGCHSYEGIKNDFDAVYPLLSNCGIICLDDTLRIDGCREFSVDLRTKYYDGTYDTFSFPWKLHGGNRFGTTFVVKRSYPLVNVPIGEICGSPSSPEEIIRKEKEWFQKEIDNNRK